MRKIVGQILETPRIGAGHCGDAGQLF